MQKGQILIRFTQTRPGTGNIRGYHILTSYPEIITITIKNSDRNGSNHSSTYSRSIPFHLSFSYIIPDHVPAMLSQLLKHFC
ncbi:hypothetical protein EYC80_003453 [Monilinia laxa]|uniref:Uncharacterized protein n=1 Tax=Monilinia laxa TaxID=61186 RepID=A0A5N6KF37_MONLA|nr:hypothetical protein EYC80_003453 [Monilinia laxa]